MGNNKYKETMKYADNIDANEKRKIVLEMLQDKGIHPDPFTQRNISEYRFNSDTKIKWYMDDTLEISTIKGAWSNTLCIKQDGSSYDICGLYCMF